PSDGTPSTPQLFTLSRTARYVKIIVNGIVYWQGGDWEYGATLDKINYLNDPAGYVLHKDDLLVAEYLV
ncbi:unnamed protein product, partial [marine sediment metagenome]